MKKATGPAPAKAPATGTEAASAYCTFPQTATHGPRDKRCFHGKPEDWRRNKVERTFGGKLK
jgi:transposase